MRKSRIIVLSSLMSFGAVSGFSQVTAIPDSNFEQALIDLGIDSDATVNGQVLTSDIQSVTHLTISNYSIDSLLGIEDFTALTHLYANTNNLTAVDFSQNLNLKIINLEENDLSSIDVSFLPNLWTLAVTDNQLTSLDLTNNLDMYNIYCSGNNISNLNLPVLPNLEELYCVLNDIDSIDLSGSPVFNKLFCNDNDLVYLNLKNGGSSYMEFFSADNNPNLTCILIDDPQQAAACCSNEIPANCIFSTDCILNTANLKENNLEFYPNPVIDKLWLDSKTKATYEIHSQIGETVLNGDLLVGKQNVDLNSLSAGIYYLKVKSSSDNFTTVKLIKM